MRNAETILTFWKLLESHLFDLAFPPWPSAAWFPVDEPVLVSIMTHDHAKDLCSSELGPLSMWYVECTLECMLEHAVLATEQLGLTRWFWRVQSNNLLITFIETHNCHRILHNQSGHFLPDLQHPGQDNMIAVVSRLPGQSSSTPVVPRTCTKQPGGSHAGCVAPKQTGPGKGGPGRLWTWKLTSFHLSPSCGAAWHGRLSQKVY